MGIRVEFTDHFRQRWSKLAPRMKKIVQGKISLLVENPGHPSLNTHRLRQAREAIRVCYININMRLIYEFRGDTLYLWDVGSHSIVDKIHRRRFAG